MKSFAASTWISAPPDAVWAILTDASRYTVWNSTIESLDGHIGPGGKIKLRTKAVPERAFALRVSRFEPPRTMTWAGGMPLGLFVGERVFELTPANGGTQFSMAETYRGLMAPMITRALPDLQPAFETFATDLKRHAERSA